MEASGGAEAAGMATEAGGAGAGGTGAAAAGAGGAGGSMAAGDAGMEAAPPTDCRPASPAATQYVDHASGTDDATHGGATGSCAYKTLTYALAHSTGSVQLVGTDTFPGAVAGEAIPYTLTGSQKIFCNNAKLTAPSSAGLLWFTGTGNTVDGCRLDGASFGGDCVKVSTSGSQTFSNNTVTNCASVGLSVEIGVGGVAVIGNTFTANNLGIQFHSSNTGTLTNNSMVTTGQWDVHCGTPSPDLTGSGNTSGGGMIKCGVCMGCPF